MAEQSGMVLGISLIILFILNLLAINGFQTNFLSSKMVQHSEQQQQNFYKAEAVLKQIEANLENVSNGCWLNDLRANIFSNKSHGWWQQYGCKLPRANYFIQDLGSDDDSCHQHFRITTRVTKNQQYPVTLQSTLIKPILKAKDCQQQSALARSSWRMV